MKNWSLLHKYIKPYRLYVLIIIISIFISSFTVLSLGEGIRYVIDNNFLTGLNWSSFYKVALGLSGIITIMSGAIFTRIYLLSYSGERIIGDIRINVYSHLLKLPQRFFEKKKIGDILSTLISDTATLQIIISGALSNALRNLAMSIGGIVMSLHTNVTLTLYSTIAVPSVIIVISLLGKKVKRVSKIARDSIANIASYSEETLHEIKTIQAFTYEKIATQTFAEHVKYTIQCFVRYEFFRGCLVVLILTTVLLTIGVVVWQGNNTVINGDMTYGELFAFIFYALIVANSISRLGEICSELQQASASLQRVEELLLEQNHEIIEAHKTQPTPTEIKSLSFSHVSFSYTPNANTPTLSDISFTINAGETAAIIGQSGAGKTTITDLIMRFYELTEGAIYINGINIKEFAIYDLRQLVSVVNQELAIFSTTIKQNILYGKPEASIESVINASKNAHADSFITKIPEQYDAFVGEKGVKLSGGQKQRLAIARAILKNAPILLLDEATSSLDTENEKLIQDSIEKLDNIITITIAHRLSTIKKADKIILIDQGKIVAIGSHKELYKHNDLYIKLVNMQGIN